MSEPKWILIIFVVALTTFVTIVGEKKSRRALAKYFSRTCTGLLWRRRFPNASKTEIRTFLNVFIDAFIFRRKHRLLFSPDDGVMEVYRACNPPDWTLSDTMELEFLCKMMQKTYGLDLVPHWRDNITLGELFALTRASR